VIMTATVTDGSSPVSSAAVHFTITSPLRTLGCDATTDGSGTASCRYTVNTNRDGTGAFEVGVKASKSGYTDGTATTSFLVQ